MTGELMKLSFLHIQNLKLQIQYVYRSCLYVTTFQRDRYVVLPSSKAPPDKKTNFDSKILHWG